MLFGINQISFDSSIHDSSAGKPPLPKISSSLEKLEKAKSVSKSNSLWLNQPERQSCWILRVFFNSLSLCTECAHIPIFSAISKCLSHCLYVCAVYEPDIFFYMLFDTLTQLQYFGKNFSFNHWQGNLNQIYLLWNYCVPY